MAVTGKQMCERIARWLKENVGIEIEPEAIWNSNSIARIVETYQMVNSLVRS